MNENIEFFDSIKDDLQLVEELMLGQANGHDHNLQDALHHLLQSGGKRLRPALCLLTGKMLSAPTKDLITLSAAIELLHTATLVHDDLIDDSLLRRGVPTLNALWSTSATVLTGDFLFACAARLAAETNSLGVIKCFAKTVTVLSNGEIVQIFSGPCIIDHHKYDERIYAKTASLFETCTYASALLSPAREEVIEKSRQFGYHLGMAFQIVDDILDFTGEQATIGKPIGNDLRQGLITLPALLFIENNLNNPIIKSFVEGKCIEDKDQIDNIIGSIIHGPYIQMAYDESNSQIQKAKAILNDMPACNERDALVLLADYINGRDR